MNINDPLQDPTGWALALARKGIEYGLAEQPYKAFRPGELSHIVRGRRRIVLRSQTLNSEPHG